MPKRCREGIQGRERSSDARISEVLALLLSSSFPWLHERSAQRPHVKMLILGLLVSTTSAYIVQPSLVHTPVRTTRANSVVLAQKDQTGPGLPSLPEINLPTLPSAPPVGALGALAFASTSIILPIVCIGVITFTTPGKQLPFNFLDQFYPPRVEEMRKIKEINDLEANKNKAAKEAADAEAAAKKAAEAAAVAAPAAK